MASVISQIQFEAEGATAYRFVVYFSEDDVARRKTYLAAAVVWLSPAARQTSIFRDGLRRLRSWLGPLGKDVHLGWRAGHWTGAMGEHGQQETLYHPERRVIRVLGREYPLAGVDETVILLVDEASSRGLDPTVTRHRIAKPFVPLTPPDKNESVREPGEGSDEANVWRRALERDPMVREFLARRS